MEPKAAELTVPVSCLDAETGWLWDLSLGVADLDVALSH